MNPKGVTTKGMWIKVFVKALPNTVTSQKNLCFTNLTTYFSILNA